MQRRLGGRWKTEDKASHLAIERVSLLLELGTSKDAVFALQVHALKEKKALEEAYEEGFDMIFNYGYGCAFVHNIFGSQPVVIDWMADTSKPLPPKFFINPRCPSGAAFAEATTNDVCPGEAMITPKREAPAAVLGIDIS